MRPPPGGFEDRLEAELVRVVSARAARQRRSTQRAVAAMRRPAVRAGVLAVGTAVAAAAVASRCGPSAQPPAGRAVQAGTRHRGRPGAHQDGRVHRGQLRRRHGPRDLGQEPVHPGQPGHREPAASPARGRVPRAHQGRRLLPGTARQRTTRRGRRRARGRPGHDGRGQARRRRSSSSSRRRRCPRGEELFIGYLSPSQLAVTHGRPGSIERLVPTGVPLTCTTQAAPRLPAVAGAER